MNTVPKPLIVFLLLSVTPFGENLLCLSVVATSIQVLYLSTRFESTCRVEQSNSGLARAVRADSDKYTTLPHSGFN